VELTKQHKVLLGVLGVGVLAVVADRVLLGGATAPEAAKAATPEVVRESKAATEVAPETTAVADRLAAFADDDDLVHDADVNAAFAERVEAPAASATASKTLFPRTNGIVCIGHTSMDTAELTAHFRAHVKLSSVILNPKPMAFISGEKFELNDSHVIGGKAAAVCQHEVKLLEVHGPDRQARRAGSAIVLIDGKHRVELVIDR
jgi:hypothetical protein